MIDIVLNLYTNHFFAYDEPALKYFCSVFCIQVSEGAFTTTNDNYKK